MAEQELILSMKIEGQSELADLKTRLDAIRDTLANFSIAKVDDTGLQKVKFEMQTLRTEISALTQKQKEYTQALKETQQAAATQTRLDANFAQPGSLLAMNEELANLVNQQQRLAVGSDAFIQMGQKIAIANEQMKQATVSATRMAGGFGQMGILGRNFNFVMQDSVYFFKNFQLGVLAIGNNLDPLVNSLRLASQEAKTLGVSFGSYVLSFLKGPGGFIVIAGLVVAAFQAIVFAMQGAKSEAEKQKDLLQELIKNYTKLNDLLDEDRNKLENLGIEKITQLYTGLNDELKSFIELQHQALVPITTQNLTGDALKFAQALNLDKAKNNIQYPGDEETQRKFNLLTASGKELSNFAATLASFGQGKTNQLLNLIPKTQLEEFQKYLKELSGKNVPSFVNELNIMGLQFSLTSAEAGKMADELQKIINPKKDKKTSETAIDIFLEQEKFNREYARYTDQVGLTSNAYDKILLKQRTELSNLLSMTKDRKEQLKIMQDLGSVASDLANIEDKSVKAYTQGRKEREKELDALKKAQEEIGKTSDSFINSAGKLVQRGQVSEENQDQTALIRRLRIRQNEEEKSLYKELIDAKIKLDDDYNKLYALTGINATKRLNQDKTALNKAYWDALGKNEKYYQQLIFEAQLQKYKVFVDALQKTLTSAFSKAWTDIFGQANSLFQQFIQNVANALADLAAQQAAKGIFSFISGLFSHPTEGGGGFNPLPLLALFFHKGGIVPKAHQGMLATDEVPIIARKGEMILNSRQQSNLFDLINNPSFHQSGGIQPIVINHVTTLDGKIIAKNQYKYLPAQLYRIQREGIPLTYANT